MDIVINRCPRSGDKLLSDEGIREYIARKYSGVMPEGFDQKTIERNDPVLVALMRDNWMKFATYCSHIRIVTVPDNSKWSVQRKGNFEWVSFE